MLKVSSFNLYLYHGTPQQVDTEPQEWQTLEEWYLKKTSQNAESSSEIQIGDLKMIQTNAISHNHV